MNLAFCLSVSETLWWRKQVLGFLCRPVVPIIWVLEPGCAHACLHWSRKGVCSVPPKPLICSWRSIEVVPLSIHASYSPLWHCVSSLQRVWSADVVGSDDTLRFTLTLFPIRSLFHSRAIDPGLLAGWRWRGVIGCPLSELEPLPRSWEENLWKVHRCDRSSNSSLSHSIHEPGKVQSQCSISTAVPPGQFT